MAEGETRTEQRDRQAREVEASQQELRDNIAMTKDLLDASDEMLKRHRQEWRPKNGTPATSAAARTPEAKKRAASRRSGPESR